MEYPSQAPQDNETDRYYDQHCAFPEYGDDAPYIGDEEVRDLAKHALACKRAEKAGDTRARVAPLVNRPEEIVSND